MICFLIYNNHNYCNILNKLVIIPGTILCMMYIKKNLNHYNIINFINSNIILLINSNIILLINNKIILYNKIIYNRNNN